jgi:hypothetical protein
MHVGANGGPANFTTYDEGNDCYSPLSKEKGNQPSPVAMIGLALKSGSY